MTRILAERTSAPDGAQGKGAPCRVFISDMVLECSIGIHPHEHDKPQRVRINVDLWIGETPAPLDDDIVNVVSYEDMTARPAETIKAVCDSVAVPFSPGLLDDVRPPTGAVRDEEKWKRQNVESRAIRPDDPERWRRTLTPSQGSLVDLITEADDDHRRR